MTGFKYVTWEIIVNTGLGLVLRRAVVLNDSVFISSFSSAPFCSKRLITVLSSYQADSYLRWRALHNKYYENICRDSSQVTLVGSRLQRLYCAHFQFSVFLFFYLRDGLLYLSGLGICLVASILMLFNKHTRRLQFYWYAGRQTYMTTLYHLFIMLYKECHTRNHRN